MDTRTSHDDTATFPFLFEPPNPSDTPQDLFKNEHRYIRKTDSREILFYTDGACLRNGQSNPQAGCAFVHRPSAYAQDGTLTHAGTVGFSLEEKGPTGAMYKHTSNRAELRAVIAVLQFRDWSVDCNAGWRSIVIATDSEYVAVGATSWATKWEVGGWKTYDRKLQRRIDVKNQDLWQLLLAEVRKLHSRGVNVSFWRIPRELNSRADKFAREVAQSEGRPDYEVIIPTGPVGIGSKP
ncbi:ribonuclease H-like protein [Cadophora sp. DSE1049]|nr:ribonuclease H-like protein [Cadophora sp. DSE1049]